MSDVRKTSKARPATTHGSADKAPRHEIEKPKEVHEASEEEQASAAWDVVDEAGWESFPASDPPAYVRGVSAGNTPRESHGSGNKNDKTRH